MTVIEARRIREEYNLNENPTREDKNRFFEATQYLADMTGEVELYVSLANQLYERGNYDEALKYYETGAMFNEKKAFVGIGYIWYFGKTGKTDYEKAYVNFRAAYELGDFFAGIKIADMYRLGHYVDRDYGKYCEMIRYIYDETRHEWGYEECVPEIRYRMAVIEKEKGNLGFASKLAFSAREFMEARLMHPKYYGNLGLMRRIVELQYTMSEFPYRMFNFFDFYWLLKEPHRISFRYKDNVYEITNDVDKDGNITIHYNGKDYNGVDDFLLHSQFETTFEGILCGAQIGNELRYQTVLDMPEKYTPVEKRKLKQIDKDKGLIGTRNYGGKIFHD